MKLKHEYPSKRKLWEFVTFDTENCHHCKQVEEVFDLEVQINELNQELDLEDDSKEKKKIYKKIKIAQMRLESFKH